MNAKTETSSNPRVAGPPLFHAAAQRPHQQRGAVLIVALIFLVLLTILALTASSGSILQLRMAGNLRNAQQALMSANTALRAAEWQVWLSAAPSYRLNCSQEASISGAGCIRYDVSMSPYAVGGDVTLFRSKAGWLSGIGFEYKGPAGSGYTSGPNKTAHLAKNPHYLIEDLGMVDAFGVQKEYRKGRTPGGEATVRELYRLTARGTGGSDKSIRVVQSTFLAPPVH